MLMTKKNIKEAKRKKALGELGELIGIKVLVDHGFVKVKNLNDKKRNYAFADIYAEKDGEKYVISIKARNKFQLNGLENLSYNLGKHVYINAEKAALDYNAKPYWMAIPFDIDTFSVYFGSLECLSEKFSIPISKCKKEELGIIKFEDNRQHYFDWDFFKNK